MGLQRFDLETLHVTDKVELTQCTNIKDRGLLGILPSGETTILIPDCGHMHHFRFLKSRGYSNFQATRQSKYSPFKQVDRHGWRVEPTVVIYLELFHFFLRFGIG